MLPPELRSIEVTPGMFQTAQHYAAWRRGEPLRTQRPRRWKIPPKWRESVMRHAGYKCQGCGCATPNAAPTIEHVIPVVLGGSNEPSNLTVLCAGCQAKSWARFRDVLKTVDAEAVA